VKVTLDLNEQMKTEMANKLMALKIRPIGDRILVQAVDEGPEKNTRGSIIIPETAKGKPMEGVVIAVGVGKIGEDGKKLFLEIKR
jgi:chaperonin GroES